MNTAILSNFEVPTVIGTPFGGGFFFGRILVDQHPHAIIVASKIEGEHGDARWNKLLTRVEGARSFFDSMANTIAMANADSQIAQWALNLRIGGFDDWCIPARDVLEPMYRYGKPTDRKNWVYRNGENPSSIPVGYPYTEDLPKQTEVSREGGPDAFDPVPYWSSTQYEGLSDFAWAQVFTDGTQSYYHKSDKFRVRVVRTIPI